MGGRGAYSFSSMPSISSSAPLNAYAVASLNRGAASGTTVEAAIGRFREQLMNEKVEYSAYIDEAGYVHALASMNNEGSTKIAPASAIAKEKGVTTIIHNHPHGGSDGRKWGGPFSEADLAYIANAYAGSGGRLNRMVATAREGTYSAKVTKKVTQSQVHAAASRAEASLKGKKYQSEIAMWRAVNKAYTSEFGKIGIKITYDKQKKRNGKLTTQKVGTY